MEGCPTEILASLSAQRYPGEKLCEITVIPGDQELRCDEQGAIGAYDDAYKQSQDEVLNGCTAEGIQSDEDE